MPSKNDLSAFKKPAPKSSILPPANEGQGADHGLTPRKRIGRPPKKPSEKRDYKITLSLTRAEGAKISQKSGLAGEATYLYDQLLKAGVFN
jgi:hypothetical protein